MPRHCPRLYAPAQPFAEAIKAWERNQQRSNGGRPLNLDPNNQVAGLGALAELAGITVRSLWRYTNGESRYIELKLADRLALALDIPLPLLADDFQPLHEWRQREAATAAVVAQAAAPLTGLEAVA